MSLAVDGERKSVLELQCKRREYVAIETDGRGDAQSWVANVVVALITVTLADAAHVVTLVPGVYMCVGHKRGIRLDGITGI